MLIYKATNIINNKQYIGQTVNSLEYRKRDHISEAMRQNNNNHFHNAIRKYGKKSFTWEIIHGNIDTIEELNKLEIYYIGYYNTFEKGYNMTFGGGGSVGRKVSEETRKKIGDTERGKNNSGATPIIIDDQYFDTRVKAASFVGINPATIRQRILHKTKWLDYSYV